MGLAAILWSRRRSFIPLDVDKFAAMPLFTAVLLRYSAEKPL